MTGETLYISSTEWYLVYTIEDDPDKWEWLPAQWRLAVSEETARRWRETFAAFNDVQDEIRRMIGE